MKPPKPLSRPPWHRGHLGIEAALTSLYDCRTSCHQWNTYWICLYFAHYVCKRRALLSINMVIVNTTRQLCIKASSLDIHCANHDDMFHFWYDMITNSPCTLWFTTNCWAVALLSPVVLKLQTDLSVIPLLFCVTVSSFWSMSRCSSCIKLAWSSTSLSLFFSSLVCITYATSGLIYRVLTKSWSFFHHLILISLSFTLISCMMHANFYYNWSAVGLSVYE